MRPHTGKTDTHIYKTHNDRDRNVLGGIENALKERRRNPSLDQEDQEQDPVYRDYHLSGQKIRS
jgi:hypothetical protein